MDIIKSLEWRYATKKMSGRVISLEKVTNILKAIQLAPSSYGLTPYNVIVVENAEIKNQLAAACYNQPQITADNSIVIVFANWNDITNDNVDEYINEIVSQRGTPIEELEGMATMIKNSIAGMSNDEKKIWAQKQTYIALGVGLTAAASYEVDATPMEGFIPSQVNEVLGLDDLGLNASVILTLGYRADDDALGRKKKVRRTTDKLFIRKK